MKRFVSNVCCFSFFAILGSHTVEGLLIHVEGHLIQEEEEGLTTENHFQANGQKFQ